MRSYRIILSTPDIFIISNATAVEALPDIGRTNIKGNTSEGIFSKFSKGEVVF